MPIVENVLVEIRIDIKDRQNLPGTGAAGFIGIMTIPVNHTLSFADIEKRVKETFEGGLTDKAKFEILNIDRDPPQMR